jgi:hypothetical protein
MGEGSFGASDLFDDHVDFVAVFHVEVFGGLVFVDALAIEEEADIVGLEALALAVGVHEFLELGGILDLEEDLLAVLALHFEVELLSCCRGCHQNLSIEFQTNRAVPLI